MRRRALLAASMSGNGEGPNDTPVDVNYLTIEALEDGLTVSMSLNACEYCVDGNREWRALEAGTNTISVNSGQTLSFKGRLLPNVHDGIGTFTVSKKCNLKGNCMSMLFDDYAAYNNLQGIRYAFYKLFYECSNIVNVSENFLPATTLATYCYGYMFKNCKALTTAPELPATTLASNCYYSMFEGCTSLVNAPELPATTLATYCYDYMFKNCKALTTAPELPATTLASNCYSSMFEGCTSLVNAPELPATTLASNCYQFMFQNCKALTTAPELPATTLASNCYYSMFRDCNNLNYIKMLATDISARYCLDYWVQGVSSTGTFVKNKNATWDVTGVDGVPSGWTIQKV